MLKTLINYLNPLLNIFKSSQNYKFQTFTYFIPAPPMRSSGYREKQFDKIFFEFINKGHEIVSINTEQCTHPNQSGMWFICTVKSKNMVSATLDFEEVIKNEIELDESFSESIIYTEDLSQNTQAAEKVKSPKAP